MAAANQLLIARDLPPKQYEVLRPCASAGARGLIGGAFGINTDHPDFIPLRDEFFANYEKALLVNSVLLRVLIIYWINWIAQTFLGAL